MAHTQWSRDHLLQTLALYCRIPFGKMHSTNPEIIKLADAIGRTASAVALKLTNFASLDPELQGRGIAGMANSSRLDREIWNEFYGHWDALADVASTEVADGADDSASPSIQYPRDSRPTSAASLTTVRRGQSFFRSAVLAAYQERCCITGIASRDLLRASHIVPWSRDETRRLDPHNGLCLNALHDAAFDRGLITITREMRVKVSSRVKHTMPELAYTQMFAAYADREIALPERFRPSQDAVEFHRMHVFMN